MSETKRGRGRPEKWSPLVRDIMRRRLVIELANIKRETKQDQQLAKEIALRLRRRHARFLVIPRLPVPAVVPPEAQQVPDPLSTEQQEQPKQPEGLDFKGHARWLLDQIKYWHDKSGEKRHLKRLRDALHYTAILAKWQVGDWKKIPAAGRKVLRKIKGVPKDKQHPGYLDVLHTRLKAKAKAEAKANEENERQNEKLWTLWKEMHENGGLELEPPPYRRMPDGTDGGLPESGRAIRKLLESRPKIVYETDPSRKFTMVSEFEPSFVGPPRPATMIASKPWPRLLPVLPDSKSWPWAWLQSRKRPTQK